MEVINHKEEVPYEHYLEKYPSLDPVETASRLNIMYDETAQKFQLRFMGHLYEVSYPEFTIRPLTKEEGEKDLFEGSISAKTFILRYLLEGQYVKSTDKFITFREFPSYGELYFKPYEGRCLKRLLYGFGYKIKAFSSAMEKIPGVQKLTMGDVSYEFELVNGYKMRFILWGPDDEFPPSAQILYSDNFQFGFHAEDLVVAGDLSITTVKILCS